jgi:4'-phosphopantetheinyl transferase
MTILPKTNNFSSIHHQLKTEQLNLAVNEVHLWTTKPQELALKFDEDDALLLKYQALLTPEECKKQQRYKFAQDRHDALITRAFIRDLLSYYADIAPQAWRFEKGEKDKPEIVDPPLPLRFNISHTKDLIICAVTLNDDIGCDVENIGRSNDVLAIAERYFSKQETTELFALPSDKQRDRFFDYWTLKESYIKAWGLGLAIPLGDFSFTIADKQTQQNSHFVIKSDITLSFAQHREDNSEVWRSWLLYPAECPAEPFAKSAEDKAQHRIALSLRAKGNNQATDYQLRFFNSLPLLGYQELD